jgi:hypothetical protein
VVGLWCACGGVGACVVCSATYIGDRVVCGEGEWVCSCVIWCAHMSGTCVHVKFVIMAVLRVK